MEKEIKWIEGEIRLENKHINRHKLIGSSYALGSSADMANDAIIIMHRERRDMLQDILNTIISLSTPKARENNPPEGMDS